MELQPEAQRLQEKHLVAPLERRTRASLSSREFLIGRDLNRIDPAIDEHARPGHAAPHQGGITGGGPEIPRDVDAKVDAEFRNDAEELTIVLADVAGEGQNSADGGLRRPL